MISPIFGVKIKNLWKEPTRSENRQKKKIYIYIYIHNQRKTHLDVDHSSSVVKTELYQWEFSHVFVHKFSCHLCLRVISFQAAKCPDGFLPIMRSLSENLGTVGRTTLLTCDVLDMEKMGPKHMIQPNQENKTYGIKSRLGLFETTCHLPLPGVSGFRKEPTNKNIYRHPPKFNGSPLKRLACSKGKVGNL